MIFYNQIFKHAPQHGVHGDCFRTTIACLLDMKPNEVPHFFQMDADAPVKQIEEAWECVRAWLAVKGFSIFTVPFQGEIGGLFQTMKAQNPGIYYMLGGASPNANHQVICCEDKIVHDPNPEKPGIIGPSSDGYYWVHLLLPSFHRRLD
jgi:hypothetical protein